MAVANAALGLFDTYSELGQRAYTIFRGSMYEGFAQDSWKVNQKLHVDFGVRYTVIVPLQRPVAQHDRLRSAASTIPPRPSGSIPRPAL